MALRSSTASSDLSFNSFAGLFDLSLIDGLAFFDDLDGFEFLDGFSTASSDLNLTILRVY